MSAKGRRSSRTGIFSTGATGANGYRHVCPFFEVKRSVCHVPAATAMAADAVRGADTSATAAAEDADIDLSRMRRDRPVLGLRDDNGLGNLALMREGRQGVVHGGVCGPGACVRPDESRRLVAEEGGLVDGRALLLGLSARLMS